MKRRSFSQVLIALLVLPGLALARTAPKDWYLLYAFEHNEHVDYKYCDDCAELAFDRTEQFHGIRLGDSVRWTWWDPEKNRTYVRYRAVEL